MTQATEARTSTGLFSSKNMKHIGNTLLDLFFPPSCVHCGRVDVGFCETCLAEIHAVAMLDDMTTTESGIVVASTAAHHGVMQSAVQALKYHNQLQMAIPLGQRLAQTIAHLNWTFDTITPVPMHTSRYRERGYNQAQELAIPLAEIVQCECKPQAIERIRATQSQVGLNRQERLSNLNDAFTAHSEFVKDKTLLLVDDVQTTGTTISMCAEAVLQAGAKHVYGITVTVATLARN